MSKNIAIFGGKFDPPHLGHQTTIFLALEKYKMDEVLIVPSFSHPFGYRSSSFEIRCEMCEIMIKPWDKDRVKVSKAEKNIGTETVYTIDLIKYLKQTNQTDKYHLFIGADNWKLKSKWHNFNEIEKLCESIVVIGRGNDLSNGFSLPDISSSQIREMVRNNIDPSPLLPDGIMEYIKNHNLYL